MLLDLSNFLETLISLKDINLNFYGYSTLIWISFVYRESCKNITDPGLQAIIQSLGKLILLENIVLCFSE